MKKLSKILLGVIPSITLASSLPVFMSSCSCSADPDIYFPSNLPKTQDLYYTSGSYTSNDNSLFSLAEKYYFDNTEELKSTRVILFKTINMRWDESKVHFTGSFTSPTLVLSSATWAYTSSQEKCCSYTGKLQILNCTLDSGAWITFDLDCTFGSGNALAKDGSFSPISKTCRIPGFKLVYN